ncbi:PTS sugar transporter subunit IIC [Clostridium intestinale]|uniref:Permease IIC component n=1 Tax=Clostridium intestinale DSM 6191 TaxID=1121320 RepID=A0A1M6C425_9CLOT|nr:PTS sugar transporter subunit IIC [Clostridium intestinale]SHI55815.1 PTS system, cellobiose-specific IIC component [Clostridium intestinale DSM 6191]
MSENRSEKLINMVMKFVELKAIVALKDGIMYTLPMSLIGSVFLLLAQIPYKPFNDWVASIFGAGWTEPLFQVYNSTMAIMAIVAVIGIAYMYAKNEGHEPLGAGIIAFAVFLITLDQFTTSTTGEVVGGVIPRTWLGGQGMVTAIIIGLSVGAVYSWFLTKKITIKMPAGVPQGVSNQFSALIPGLVIITATMFIYMFFKYALNTTLIGFIFKVLQTPLQGFTDSLFGLIITVALVPFFWWFGVHGASIVGGVIGGLQTANRLDNQAIIDAGRELTLANGGHIVTDQFNASFVTVGGSGLTLGLVIAMIIIAKSEQTKALGKIAIGPGLFNINEPIIFGFPMVMNPLMFIPFVAAPTISAVVAYLAMRVGLVPLFTGVTVPWTTPPIISGFIMGGWRMALLQIVCIAISVVVYFPFLLKQDAMNLKSEQELEA